MHLEIPDELALRLRALAGEKSKPGVPPEQTALELLVDLERYRRGAKDPVSGAYHPIALTQGSLVKDEYDLSTHGHLPAWTVGVVTADLRGTILLNARYGFPVGDRVLRTVVDTLAAELPRAKIVRAHGDGFAALLLPSSGLTLAEEMKSRVGAAVSSAVRAVLPDDGEPAPRIDVTVALLELEIVKPSHWQVLGPLLWAEAERAHVVERSGAGGGIQRRHLALNGDVPVTHYGG